MYQQHLGQTSVPQHLLLHQQSANSSSTEDLDLELEFYTHPSQSAPTNVTAPSPLDTLEGQMSRLDILPACNPVDFDIEISSSISPTFSQSFPEKYFQNAVVTDLVSSPPHLRYTHSASAGGTSHPHEDEQVTIPGLPPLHRGHSDIHLRNGVMTALHLAADAEPDAEKAFFVADLSYVFQQHLRWKRNLPEIIPFFGESTLSPPGLVPTLSAQHSSHFDLPSDQMQPGPICPPTSSCRWDRIRLCIKR